MNRLLLLLAAIVGLPTLAAAQSPGEVVEYYHLDALGSVRAVTAQNGSVVRRHDFKPFGEEVNAPVPNPDRKLFTGHERDGETGFDYFGARYYRAALGRFAIVDPELNIEGSLVNPQKWNRYAYVLNNPLRYIDKNGREEDAAYSLYLIREQVRRMGGDAAVAQMDRRNAIIGLSLVGGLAAGTLAVEAAPPTIALGLRLINWLGDKLGIAEAAPASRVASTALRFDPSTIFNDAHKVAHMFKEVHQLELLGTRTEALGKIVDATQRAYSAGTLSMTKAGEFGQYLWVAGQKVFVQGRVIGDTLRIGDAWIPKI